MTRPTLNSRCWRSVPLLALIGVATTILPGSAAPRAVTAPVAATAVPLPAACKPNPSPPPTEYGFVARVRTGTVTGAGPLRITDIDVSVCGVVRVVDAQSGSNCEGIQARLIVPAEGIVTNRLNASLAIVGMPAIENVPTEVEAVPMSSNVACDDSAGGLKMDLDLRINGSAGVFGLQCKVPLTGTVTGTVTGDLLEPPYRGETTIEGAVEIGAMSNNDRFCPGRLPQRLNALVGLPAAGYRVDWPADVSIYHP